MIAKWIGIKKMELARIKVLFRISYIRYIVVLNKSRGPEFRTVLNKISKKEHQHRQAQCKGQQKIFNAILHAWVISIKQ